MGENHNCSNYGGEEGCTRCMKALRVEVKLLRDAIDKSNEALADALSVREERNRLVLQYEELKRAASLVYDGLSMNWEGKDYKEYTILDDSTSAPVRQLGEILKGTIKLEGHPEKGERGSAS